VTPAAGPVPPPLADERLRGLRVFAQELAQCATLAHQKARRELAERPLGEPLLGGLHHFAAQARGLSLAAQAVPVDRAIAVSIEQLLEDARRTDRRIRVAGVFHSAWDDCTKSITLLSNMSGLLRA
jgi:hypothetical protein